MADSQKFKTPFASEIQPVSVGDDPQTAEELRRAQQEEYGQYVAAELILIGGVPAFLPGHAVPAGHVSDEGPVLPSQVVPRQQAQPAQQPQQPSVERQAGSTPGKA